MSNAISTLKLHLNKRQMTFSVPLQIVLVVAVVSVLISLFFWRAGSIPGSAGWIEGSRNNPAMMWSLPGFLVYMGVQSVGTTFPFALSLGAIRRDFAAGTLLWAATMSAYLTVVLVALTLLELATGHWFAGFHIFDVYVLGAGDILLLAPIVFLGTLASLTIGAVFGASWVRFGSRGPLGLATGLAITIIVALIVLLPEIEQFARNYENWWLAVLALALVALSSLGVWLFLRPAIVR